MTLYTHEHDLNDYNGKQEDNKKKGRNSETDGTVKDADWPFPEKIADVPPKQCGIKLLRRQQQQKQQQCQT